MSETLLRLCPVDTVRPSEPLRVDVDGYPPFCVYRVDGRFFVTEDTCTHGEASLGEEGDLDGFVITCTWHMGQFDIRTGEALTTPCSVDIKSFPVMIIDQHVCIDTGSFPATDE